MKLLVYGINYSPELTGIGKYTGEMCEWLAAKGHNVEVITSMPYYPEWITDKKYKNRLWHSEVIKGVKVFRTPFYVPRVVTPLARIIHEFSFVVSSLVHWLPRFFRKYDAVIVITPPLQSGILPFLYSSIRSKPLIFHVQDLQVDAARELEMIKNRTLLSILERVEKFLMSRASRVSVISEGMRKRIISKGIKEEKIIHLPNWTDTDYIKPLPKKLSLKSEFKFEESDKIILYSGNMGEKQGLEAVINVAEKLKNHPSLKIVFSGEGPAKKRFQNLVEAKGLDNVRFFGLQPYEKLNKLLAMADLHLVIQRKGVSDLVFPSKLMTILSTGGVALVTAAKDTGLYQFVKNNNLALIVEPENEDDLLNSILQNVNREDKEKSDNARRYAENELNINKILVEFEQTLFKLTTNDNREIAVYFRIYSVAKRLMKNFY